MAGRAIAIPRGKVLGGCSATNAMQWYRGHPADYDAWEAAGRGRLDLRGHAPYFRRSEDWEGGASASAAAGGPMRVTRPPDPHPIAAAMVEGAAELGLPKLDDANAGETGGAALADLNIAEGRRFSVVDGYLPAWAPPPAPGQVPVGAWTRAPDPPANLTVLTGSTALRLGFSAAAGPAQAAGATRFSTASAARCARPGEDRGRARARRLRHARAARPVGHRRPGRPAPPRPAGAGGAARRRPQPAATIRSSWA